jgi:flagellar protein FliS
MEIGRWEKMSGAYNNPQTAYQQIAVGTATPEKLLIMLFSGQIKFLRQAEQALKEKKYEEAHNLLLKAGDIITELNMTLDLEAGGELAANLRALYQFYHGEIIKANTNKDPSYLGPVIAFFESFRETWVEAAKKVRLGAK